MGTTGTVWPADAVGGNPSYTGRSAREGIAPVLGGATSARPFGGINGVRPGTVNPVTANSTTWSASVFGGVIDLEASNLAGPYSFAFNLATGGSVTPSNAANPRIDTLSVRINDGAEGDGTAVAPFADIVYTTGTAAASPTVPAAPARSFIVALLTFPAGTGTTPTVSWVAPYTVAAGGIGEVNTFAELGVYSYITAPRTNTLVRALDTNITYRWTGSVWDPQDTGWVQPTLGSGWTNVVGSEVKYRRINGVVFMQGRATTVATTANAFTLPAGFRPSSQIIALLEAGGATTTRSTVTTAGVVGQITAAAATNVSFVGFGPFPADA